MIFHLFGSDCLYFPRSNYFACVLFFFVCSIYPFIFIYTNEIEDWLGVCHADLIISFHTSTLYTLHVYCYIEMDEMSIYATVNMERIGTNIRVLSSIDSFLGYTEAILIELYWLKGIVFDVYIHIYSFIQNIVAHV